MADDSPELVSQREAARRLGISHTAVQKAVAVGRITSTPSGELDFSEAARAFEEKDEPMKITEWRAKLLELEYLEKIGELVSKRETREGVRQLFRVTRDRLLAVADRVAPQVAAERDPARAHRLIKGSIEEALKVLADWARQEASREETGK